MSDMFTVWQLKRKSAHAYNSHDSPDSKVYGANMGPTWGRQDPCVAYVRATWTLLSGPAIQED